uniref:Uncharacterized protein n=1 Tax=Myoviridae sp. ct7113 TaxID=2825037 RepID=A0A8S5UY89_9CAUD|nr:MAG TPA: hypothetical protein [Myoviridae sp. ct7113]
MRLIASCSSATPSHWTRAASSACVIFRSVRFCRTRSPDTFLLPS